MSDAYGRVIAPFTVRFERLLPGPIERVWEYICDGEKRGKWIASGEMERKVGGVFELNFDHETLSPEKVKELPERFQNRAHRRVGKVLEIDPPHFLHVTWGADQSSNVTFELKNIGDKVLLTVTHRDLANQNSVLSVGSGWHAHLATLRDVLEGRTPPHFWTRYAKLADEFYDREFAKE